MPIDSTTLVADIPARHPRAIPVFERHGIDFCCGGGRPRREVCRERGLDAAALVGEVEAAAATESPADRTFNDAPLDERLDHIVGRYHVALREDLPRLAPAAEKVAEVHGGRHAELAERVFPAVRRLAGPGRVWSGEEQAALHGLEEEHDHAGEALARPRALSSGFAVPADGCSTYRALYEGLARFERELHEHVHLENNVLFPRVVSRSAGAVSAASR